MSTVRYSVKAVGISEWNLGADTLFGVTLHYWCCTLLIHRPCHMQKRSFYTFQHFNHVSGELIECRCIFVRFLKRAGSLPLCPLTVQIKCPSIQSHPQMHVIIRNSDIFPTDLLILHQFKKKNWLPVKAAYLTSDNHLGIALFFFLKRCVKKKKVLIKCFAMFAPKCCFCASHL